ncbi:WecB/TagA/CpsF family glycosyltransferase [Congregibacter sp.]|uniref:WecB/TagA/CpsF family glycosyltransferase n=1 Tax=Congregibacter sp. TaxID=2744308 RepID=UPI003F6B3510
MSTLAYQPDRNCFNSLGIPVDNLTLEEAVERIIAMAKVKSGPGRLVSTLNTHFLVNSLGTSLSRPRHPELLETLRNSDLITADGFPIVWLSRLLGRPIKERVCGSDIVPAVAERAAQEGLSVFLLGGAAGVAEEAGRVLEALYPGLCIAGSAAPKVTTTGSGLAESALEDQVLLAKIHESKADILLVGLGNPKQELWFNRNRKDLRTPVSIGVGGTFEFVTGAVKRAPIAWQKMNLEWAYRTLQDPVRLGKRYGKCLLELLVLASPMILQRAKEALLLRKAKCPGLTALPWQLLWSSRHQSIALLAIPRRLGVQYLRRINDDLAADVDDGKLSILDFSNVRHIELNAQQELFNLASLLSSEKNHIQLLGIRPQLRRQLTIARLMDLLEQYSRGSIDSLAGQPAPHTILNCQSYALENATLTLLGGRVNRASLCDLGFVECMLHSIRDRHCIIDFRRVNLLESSGIAELIPLLTYTGGAYSTLYLSGVSDSIRQMLRMSEIDYTATVISDNELLGLISQGSRMDAKIQSHKI